MSVHLPMEETEVFLCFTEVAHAVWSAVQKWNSFAKDTTGKQLVRAMDSVGANLVEGDGRYSDAEAIHFFEIARGSAREAKYWINIAKARRLLSDETAMGFVRELERGTQMLNALINYRRRTKNVAIVREEEAAYPKEQTPRTRNNERPTPAPPTPDADSPNTERRTPVPRTPNAERRTPISPNPKRKNAQRLMPSGSSRMTTNQ